MSAVVWFLAGWMAGVIVTGAVALVLLDRIQREHDEHEAAVTHLDAWTRRTGGDAA